MNRSTSSDISWGNTDPQDNSSEDSVVSRFTDENIRGESASCVVYRMRWQGLRVAVKRLRAEYRTDPTYVAAFRKEYQLGQQLKHDALPVYRKMHENVDEVYIIMDFIDGVSLEDFLDSDDGQEYFSSVENVRRFLTQLLDVVTYLHRSGIIHCDIKPANIMLRHSDRGVMLLDLDKCYSDSLDRTHGGTAFICDALAKGEKPTVAKDVTAIGNLMDYIAAGVPKFPARRFRRFRDVCRGKDATDERLSQALQYQSKVYLWLIGFAALCIVGGAYFLIQSSGDSERKQSSQLTSPAGSSDTVRIIERVPSGENTIPSTDKPQSQPKTVADDFDNRMSAFIREAIEAIAALRKGNAADKEIRNMIPQIIESYSLQYQSLLSAYKSENPDMPGFDVEMAVASASERSKATALLQQFTQAASDTLEHRYPQLSD